jgi:hypothetical protein
VVKYKFVLKDARIHLPDVGLLRQKPTASVSIIAVVSFAWAMRCGMFFQNDPVGRQQILAPGPRVTFRLYRDSFTEGWRGELLVHALTHRSTFEPRSEYRNLLEHGHTWVNGRFPTLDISADMNFTGGPLYSQRMYEAAKEVENLSAHGRGLCLASFARTMCETWANFINSWLRDDDQNVHENIQEKFERCNDSMRLLLPHLYKFHASLAGQPLVSVDLINAADEFRVRLGELSTCTGNGPPPHTMLVSTSALLYHNRVRWYVNLLKETDFIGESYFVQYGHTTVALV